jgi:hypothetical protein
MFNPLKSYRNYKHQKACERADVAWKLQQYEVLKEISQKYDIVLKPKAQ